MKATTRTHGSGLLRITIAALVGVAIVALLAGSGWRVVERAPRVDGVNVPAVEAVNLHVRSDYDLFDPETAPSGLPSGDASPGGDLQPGCPARQDGILWYNPRLFEVICRVA